MHALAAREEGDRHRRLLRRFVEDPRDTWMAPHHAALRGTEADLRVLSRALRPVRPRDRRTGREPVKPEHVPFIDLRPGEDDAAVRAAITPRTVAIVPVHLYGQPADMQALHAIAQRRSLAIVEDCCQAHLATSDDEPVGTRSVGGAFSFYPTKNLGAFGDGGAVITNDASIADRIRRLRNGGQVDRYIHVDAGVNSRPDDLQAAVLRARLPLLPRWTVRRRALAAAYRRLLAAAACPDPSTSSGSPRAASRGEQSRGVRPLEERNSGHVYHLFVV